MEQLELFPLKDWTEVVPPVRPSVLNNRFGSEWRVYEDQMGSVISFSNLSKTKKWVYKLNYVEE